jgi:DNA-binding response OmpR family regulator
MDSLMPTTRVLPERPILVVDDDRKIVALVRAYLEREGYHVQSASDGREALSRFRETPPALIVLDVMLPELDGLEVCRVVRGESDVPILMLSARSAVADRIRGLERGADDYLPKPFSPAELVVRVRTILRRAQKLAATGEVDPLRKPGTPAVLQHGDLRLDLERYEVHRGTELVPLTAVEFRLLAALLMADGRVLTRNQLLDAVYGAGDGDVLDRTVDVHIGRLRDKLGDDADHPRYVATVRGAGYRAAPLRQDPPPQDLPLPKLAS